MGLRPVGAERAEHQPRHHPLPIVEVGQSAEQGDDGVGAGVEQVVVAEGAQGHVLGAACPKGHRPRPLALVEPQRVVLRPHLVDAGLGVVGGDLSAHHLVVEAAGHQGHAVGVTGHLQGERLGHRDGLEEVLDAQQRPLSRARRHCKQDRRSFV